MTNKLKQDQLSINNLYPPFTAPPALASWAWRNQETATADDTYNATRAAGIYLLSFEKESL